MRDLRFGFGIDWVFYGLRMGGSGVYTGASGHKKGNRLSGA